MLQRRYAALLPNYFGRLVVNKYWYCFLVAYLMWKQSFYIGART